MPNKESQRHGFDWENAIKASVFGLTEKLKYTSMFDVPAEKNPHDSTENISIKTFGKDTICAGHACRVYSYKDVDKATMIAVRYEQKDDDTKALQEVLEINVGGPEAHIVFFGTVSNEEILALVAAINAVPPGKPSAAARAAIHAQKRALNGKSGVIKFNPKMDSDKQRRLQCSIPKVSKFLKEYPSFLVSRTTVPIVRGVSIPAEISSTRRPRNKKQAQNSALHSPPTSTSS